MGWKFNRARRRYLEGEMTPQERADFERWMDSLSTEQEEANIEWPAESKTALLQKIKTKMNQPKPDRERAFVAGHTWLKMAAALGVLTVASWLLVPRIISPIRSTTPVQEHDVRKTILADGTLVWLQGDSYLAYHEEASGRYAMLTGDALFEVAKQPTRPFVISCGELRVQVTGTSFSLHTAPDTLVLTVLTGKVNVYSTSDTSRVHVLPNEKLVYINHGTVSRRAAVKSDVPGYFRATEYNMAFTHATLGEIFTRIEKKFNVSITVTNQAVTRCMLTADFTDLSLEATLHMIAQVHGIAVTQRGTTITISGAGC